jgi:hypothetical protein
MVDLAFCLEGPSDYWFDVGFLESRRRLVELDSAQWADLQSDWHAQGPEWQERLAYILGDTSERRELVLLFDMLVHGDVGTSMSAAEALRDVPFRMLQEFLLSYLLERRLPQESVRVACNTNELLDEAKRALSQQRVL